MPRVVAMEEAQSRKIDRGTRQRYPFFNSSPDHPERPLAFLTTEDPGRVIGTHFHMVPQWQVVTEGSCTLAREEVSAYCIHFTRAFTPYGPLVCDEKEGMANFVMFTRYQPGAQYKMEMLKEVPNRQPWQIKRFVTFPSQEGRPIPSGVEMKLVPDVEDENGLFAYSLTMGPNTNTTAPDPSRGEGQYILVLKGGLRHGGKEQKAMVCIFVEPQEGPFKIEAGSEGLEALILNFPKEIIVSGKSAASPVGEFKKYQCELCAFTYDEALGMPEDGILPGTKWEDVPEDWICPDCSAAKSDFKMAEIE